MSDERQPTLGEIKARILAACHEEMRVVLDRHGCDLRATAFLTADGRITARVEIFVKE